MRKVDFWTSVHAFWRILDFSKIHWSLVLEAKINFNRMRWLEWILEGVLNQIWVRKCCPTDSKFDCKATPVRGVILERFWGESEANGVHLAGPRGGFWGGGWGNLFRKENKHPRLVHPLKGVGGYLHTRIVGCCVYDMYIYIYIF